MTATAPQTHDPLIGRTFGSVKLTARLGAGAMGVVYRGWHTRLDREVAVKLLLSNRSDKPTYRERFLREGQAAAKVRHEHVVQVLEAGQEGDIAFLVMEFVNGVSLGSMLDETKLLPSDVVQRLGVGIALGLAAMHAKGIVHRDIKPDNILLGSDQKPKVADLGLAKLLDDPDLQRLTATGIVVGTPLYLSPEGIRDPQTISAKSDIYSLGCTLYQMLTGRAPFSGASPIEVMHGHLDEKPQPIRNLRPEVPEGIAALVERCLSKEPSRRPSALELADLLSQGGDVPKQRSSLIWGVIAAAMLLIGVGWWLFARTSVTERTASAEAAAAQSGSRLVLTGVAGPLRLRVDAGDWKTVDPAGQLVAPGTRNLVVEREGGGPLLRATTSLVIAVDGDTTWQPLLVPVPVEAQRVPVAGEGLVIVDGVAYGTDPVVSLFLAGSYATTRCTGDAWQSATIVIDDRGTLLPLTWSRDAAPPTLALFRTRDDRGQAIAAHHVVAWWLAEQVRERASLPAADGWMSQGSKPQAPALDVSATLVEAIASAADTYGATVPDRTTAEALAIRLQSSLWCRDSGALAKAGDLGTPLLVLVPK